MRATGGTKTFADMKDTIKKEPITTLEVKDDEIEKNTHAAKLKTFVKKLEK